MDDYESIVESFFASCGLACTFELFLKASKIVSSRCFHMNDTECVVPLCDLFNHSETEGIHVEVSEEPDHVNGAMDQMIDNLQITTQKNHQKDEELFNTYGKLSSTRLLYAYGFMLEPCEIEGQWMFGNDQDSVNLVATLDDAHGVWWAREGCELFETCAQTSEEKITAKDKSIDDNVDLFPLDATSFDGEEDEDAWESETESETATNCISELHVRFPHHPSDTMIAFVLTRVNGSNFEVEKTSRRSLLQSAEILTAIFAGREYEALNELEMKSLRFIQTLLKSKITSYDTNDIPSLWTPPLQISSINKWKQTQPYEVYACRAIQSMELGILQNTLHRLEPFILKEMVIK